MSPAGFLVKLLDGAEVVWLPLGDVTQYEQPTKYIVQSANYSDAHTTPVLTAGKSFILGYTDETDGIYEGSQSPVIIFDDFTTANKWADFDFKVKSSAMKMINSSDDARFILRYVFHWLNTMPTGLVDGDHKRQWISNYCNKKIPIPCPDDPEKSLAIQGEIVRILDTFTEVTAELTDELAQRKKQYNYYRDQLLTFDDSVGSEALSQCCLSISDGDHQAPPKVEAGIPFITISNVSENKTIDFSNTKFVPESYYDEIADKRKARTNDILYTVVGSYGIPILIEDDRKFAFQRHIAILRPNENLLVPKYLYYALQSSEFMKQAHAVAVGAAQKTITLTALNRMQIPIPSLAEQARIVAKLDKLDALTTSHTEGLPREIELRQKQYEYYRDQLLSFPKPDAEAA